MTHRIMASRTIGSKCWLVVTFVLVCSGCSSPDDPPSDAGTNTNNLSDADANTNNSSDADAEPGPTCDDGVHNGDESGVDCGGSCPNQDCCQNGYLDTALGETDVDCGGSCAPCLVPECDPSSNPCAGGEACCGGQCVSGICYFVSNAGDDSNDGLTESTPWQSLDQVNGFTLSPGDGVFFKRGDTWTGTVTVSVSGTDGNPILYGAYDSGPNPRIYGSEVISGWTLHSGNIYQATVTADFNQVFVNDVKMMVARVPNSGYFNTDSVQGSTQLTSSELDTGIDYTGAKWFGRTNAWMADLKDVTASSGTTLTLDSAPNPGLGADLGFFLMNKLEFLDSPGEWYLDSATNTLYLWTPSGDSPANYTVRGSIHDYGFEVGARDYIVIRSFDLFQHAHMGIRMNRSDHTTLDSNNIQYPDAIGIYDIAEAQDQTITNNTVTGATHYGMELRISNSLVTDNRILKSGLFENVGLSGTGVANAGIGARLLGADGTNVFRHNRIIEAGYHGLYFAKPDNLIEYNFIQDTCLFKGDGGAIYASWSNSSAPGTMGSVVRYNIILNVVGPMEGYTGSRSYGNGIYIDEASEGVTIEYNTVAHCSNSAIFLHDNADTEVRYNTVLDARNGMAVNREHGVNSLHHNTIYVLDAVVDGPEPNQFLARRTSASSSVFDDNLYYSHYNSAELFRASSGYVNFADWLTETGQDANSVIDTTPLGVGETEELFYNDTKLPKDFVLSGTYRDLDGNAVSSPLTLQPFTSQILIRE